jgi:uncharacterized membrane protein YdjX (TVP38/TMEM64 family)
MSTDLVPPEAPPQSGPVWSRWLLAGLLVLAVAAFYLLDLQRYLAWDYLRAHREEMQAWVRQHPIQAVLAYMLVYTAVTALSLPAAAALSLLGGALFDFWVGVVAANLASTLGASLAFLSTRYLFRDFVQRRLGARLEPIQRGIDRDGAYYLFTMRLLPVLPFFLINAAMGLTRMRLGTFWWVSQLGMLPLCLVYINAGRQLGTLESPRDVLSPVVILSLVLPGVVPLLLRLGLRLWQKRIK